MHREWWDLGEMCQSLHPTEAHAHFKFGLGHATLLWPEGSQKSNPSELLVHLNNENIRNPKIYRAANKQKSTGLSLTQKSNLTSLFLLLHSIELNEVATKYFTAGSYLIWHTESVLPTNAFEWAVAFSSIYIALKFLNSKLWKFSYLFFFSGSF